jgi:hypothetical protein
VRRLVAVILTVILFAVSLPAQAATLSCSHSYSLTGNGTLHEFTPPTSWPGTRAAHKVNGILSLTGASVTLIAPTYTKSGWWDPTWDYYKTDRKTCLT